MGLAGLASIAGIVEATKDYIDAQKEIKAREEFDKYKEAEKAYNLQVNKINADMEWYFKKWNDMYEEKSLQLDVLHKMEESLRKEIDDLAKVHKLNWEKYHELTNNQYKEMEEKSKQHLYKLVRHQGKGWTLPDTNYVGPGNAMSSFVVSNTDAIAFAHDWRYELAKNSKEIDEADKIAISEFATEYEKNGAWQAYVGKLGLSAKSWLYNHFNFTFYPSFPPETAPTSPRILKPQQDTTNRLVIFSLCLVVIHLMSHHGKDIIGILLIKAKNFMLFKPINLC